MPTAALLQKEKTELDYRPLLSDDDWPREAGADAAGAEGAEGDGRDSIAGARGAGGALGAEYERVGCGMGVGVGATRGAAAGA